MDFKDIKLGFWLGLGFLIATMAWGLARSLPGRVRKSTSG